MSRQRAPNGQIFLKKDEKITDVLTKLPISSSDDEIVSKFREIYPDDWGKIVARYEAHERLTPPEKSHPMAPPRQYLLNAVTNTRKRQKKNT